MRKCRNWQTSKTKDLVAVMSCGFKSHLPHSIFLLQSLEFSGLGAFFISEFGNIWVRLR